MVAKVNSGKNILGLLNYNENKVKERVAKCIMENHFGCNVDRLSFTDKFKTFQGFIQRNSRTTTKAVHISLNFDPSERLQEDILKEIATKYMEKIGFGNQPYLVYQHFDAAHPHIHIVTTNIQKDGKRIKLFRIGKYESEKARKSLESEYNLVRAQGRKSQQAENVDALQLQRGVYGKVETKRTIVNAVRYVTKKYRYTSIPELNAVLRQYNIMADLGKEGSQMNLKKGLLYRLLDNDGKKIGVAIKASSIYGKPTLPYLEKQFKLNETLRREHKGRLIECIDNIFGNKQSISKTSFVQALSRDGIFVLFRQNEEGRIYGVTFVDNKTKVVFNGSDLGKTYGAKTITDRLTGLSKPDSVAIQPPLVNAQERPEEKDSAIEDAIKDLITAKQFDYSSPDAAMKRRKRKKRRGRSI
jgi:hypothetical protein